MKVYNIPYHDRGHINVNLVLQSCTDPLQILPGTSSETFPASSGCTYDVGNVKFEEDICMPEFEEVNVKTQKEECLDIKHEGGIYSEEEKEEEEEIDTKEDEDRV